MLRIQRIDDVVNPPEGIVYEIQHSPISLKEAQCRNCDYRSLGYAKNLSLAELYLRHHLSYHTSITSDGHGFFYDQLEFFDENQRFYQEVPATLVSPLLQKIPQLSQRLPNFFATKKGAKKRALSR